jgi:GntR family transcriptional repressor for pyruvate dehydrogenase complex
VIENPEAFLVADVELHDVIRETAGNSILGRFMESIHALGLASRQATGAKRKVREQSVRDHRAIVAALREHDGDAAADAMRHHLENVERAGRGR